jgi:hypothetical protein
MIRPHWTYSYRAKLARADEHLGTLYRETDAWGDRNPFRITRQANAFVWTMGHLRRVE